MLAGADVRAEAGAGTHGDIGPLGFAVGMRQRWRSENRAWKCRRGGAAVSAGRSISKREAHAHDGRLPHGSVRGGSERGGSECRDAPAEKRPWVHRVRAMWRTGARTRIAGRAGARTRVAGRAGTCLRTRRAPPGSGAASSSSTPPASRAHACNVRAPSAWQGGQHTHTPHPPPPRHPHRHPALPHLPLRASGDV